MSYACATVCCNTTYSLCSLFVMLSFCSVHASLLRLLMLVRPSSSLESDLLSLLSSRIESSFSLIHARFAQLPATQCLLQLFHFLSSFLLLFSSSRDAAVEAVRNHPPGNAERESIAIPQETSSTFFLGKRGRDRNRSDDSDDEEEEEEEDASAAVTAAAAESTAASSSSAASSSGVVPEATSQSSSISIAAAASLASADASWSLRLSWVSSLLSRFAPMYVEHLQANFARLQEDITQAPAETLGLSTTLGQVLGLLLPHAAMRSFRRRLLASLLRTLLAAQEFSIASHSTDLPLFYSVLQAVVCGTGAEEWPQGEEEEEEAVHPQEERQLVQRWVHEQEEALNRAPPCDANGKEIDRETTLFLPAAIATYLAKHLVKAELGKKTKGGQSSRQWTKCAQQFCLFVQRN